MNNTKPVTVPFATHFKLSADMSQKIYEKIEHMSSVPYSSAVSSIMYVMVCTQPDISHAVKVVRYSKNTLELGFESYEWLYHAIFIIVELFSLIMPINVDLMVEVR